MDKNYIDMMLKQAQTNRAVVEFTQVWGHESGALATVYTVDATNLIWQWETDGERTFLHLSRQKNGYTIALCCVMPDSIKRLTINTRDEYDDMLRRNPPKTNIEKAVDAVNNWENHLSPWTRFIGIISVIVLIIALIIKMNVA